jgi:hypothetical protein
MGVVAVGCSASSSEDAASGEDAVKEAKGGEARTTTGNANAQTGEASVKISLTLPSTSIADLKAKIGDRELGMWKGLKRPGQVQIGNGPAIRMPGAGSALFSEMKRNGEQVEAYMPFSESGLRSYSGLTFKFSYEMTDTADGFTLDIKNADKVETKLLNVDVIAKDKLTFKLTAVKSGDDVKVTLEENVAILKAKDKVGKLLGCAVAVADALEASAPAKADKAPAPADDKAGDDKAKDDKAAQ